MKSGIEAVATPNGPFSYAHHTFNTGGVALTGGAQYLVYLEAVNDGIHSSNVGLGWADGAVPAAQFLVFRVEVLVLSVRDFMNSQEERRADFDEMSGRFVPVALQPFGPALRGRFAFAHDEFTRFDAGEFHADGVLKVTVRSAGFWFIYGTLSVGC